MLKDKQQLIILIVAVAIFGFYVLGLLFPTVFWATNELATLPGPLGIGLALLGVGLILMPLYLPKRENAVEPKQLSFPQNLGIISGVTLLAGVLFHNFPIHLDVYGDARYLIKAVDIHLYTWKDQLWDEFFSFRPLYTKTGTATIYSITNLGAWLTGASGLTVLKWVDTFSGMAFVFIWLVLVNMVIKERGRRILFSLLGITAPFLLMFFGHYEIYAPSMPLMLLFAGGLITVFRVKKQMYRVWALVGVGLVLLLNIKFHITAYLLVPAFFLTVLWVIVDWKVPNWKALFTWKWSLIWLGIPAILAGGFVYGYLTKSFNGSRQYTETTLSDALFLPVVGPDGPPWDRYDLFSFAHILDYVGLMLFWSAGALFLLAVILICFRKQIKWNQPLLIIMGLTFLGYVASFFVLNPLLGIAVDWDLFARPAPLFLVFVLLLAGELPASTGFARKVGGSIGAFALMGITFFALNAYPSTLSRNLEYDGIRSFKTYWIGSTTLLNASVKLRNLDPEADIALRESWVEELEPYAVEEVDVEFADVLHQIGILYLDSLGQREKALSYFQRSDSYEQHLIQNIHKLVITYFILGRFEEAHAYTRKLISVKYPTQQKAYKISIHTAVEARAYEDALVYCEEYLSQWPEDQFVLRVYNALASGENLDSVRLLFKQG